LRTNFNNHSCSGSIYKSNSKRFIITEKLSKRHVINEQERSYYDEDDESWHKELTEDDMEFLINNTGFQSEQIRRWHVEFLNKCSSGLITNEQFKTYYRNLLPKNLNEKSKEEIIEKLFILFDIDGDGCLSFTEFLVSFWIRCKAPIKEKYTWIFNMLDEDRNGYLNYSELRNALTLCLNLNDLDELLEELNIEQNKKFKNKTDSTSDECTDYNSDDFDSKSSSESFLFINTETLKTKNCSRKHDLYSQTVELIDDKLNETVHLLHNISQKYNQITTSSLSCSSTESSFSYIGKKNSSFSYFSSDSLDSLNNIETNNCVQIKRENFLQLCEKYKTFRKLLLPIKYFYEENLFIN
jgi:Ca2+-binding EF-hand superfamily protein